MLANNGISISSRLCSFQAWHQKELKVVALLLSSPFVESVACLKFLTKSINFDLVTESKSSEKMDATSLQTIWPMTVTIVC